jgi:molybdate transport system ATP-binding protein
VILVDIQLARDGFTLAAAFEAPSNGVTALFGRSGSGKTTIINAIAGLMRPDKGRISVADQVLFDSKAGIDLPIASRRLGYVFQEGRLFPHMSVRRNLLYGRNEGADQHPTLAETVELLGLERLLDRRPGTLSGGERQRVAIGRALLAGPRILLMDEPLASLDAARRTEILPYLAALRDELDIPAIYVSHQVDEVIRLADTMVLLSDGKVAATGAVEDLTSRLDLAPLTGRHDAGAVVPCRIAEQDSAYGLTRLDFNGGALWVGKLDLPIGEPVKVRIGARDIALGLSAPSNISMLNVIECQITEIRETTKDGPQVDVALIAGQTSLWAKLTRRSVAELGLEPGMRVHALIKSVSINGASLGRAGRPPRET